MDTSLPQHIREFANVARERFAMLGGAQAALRAESDPQVRAAAAAALADLGISDLAPRTDSDDTLAAAAVCRAAGAAQLPYPVVDELMSVEGARMCLVDPAAPRVDHGDLDGDWLLADLSGTSYSATIGRRANAKLGPFLVPATGLVPNGSVAASDIRLHLILGSWWLLGAVELALQIAGEHVRARTQFGKPLAEFQAVRFSVADGSVAVRGLEELAKYSIWRWNSMPDAIGWTDALMLRIKAAETAVYVMRTSHQLLGALGFCDESDISVIDRHIQPAVRLPASTEQLAQMLATGTGLGQVETLYS